MLNDVLHNCRGIHKNVFHLCMPLMCIRKLGGGERIRMSHKNDSTAGDEVRCVYRGGTDTEPVYSDGYYILNGFTVFRI